MGRRSGARSGRAGVPPVLGGTGWARRENGPDGDWMVRSVPGAENAKGYRCPGCDHEICPGTAHVVAWPVGEEEHRRHWHTPCWAARTRRSPTRRRR